MPSYQKLQCRLSTSAPYILVACDGGLQRKKINTDDHLCSCSGGTELDKAAKFRISRSAWCTFSRGEQIRGHVHRENEHRGAHFRGWCTNSLANLCAGARLRGGERIRCYTGHCVCTARVNTLVLFSRFWSSSCRQLRWIDQSFLSQGSPGLRDPVQVRSGPIFVLHFLFFFFKIEDLEISKSFRSSAK